MKIQIIFLVVCVVASFALPDRNPSVNSEIREDAQEQEFVPDQEAAVINNSQGENLDEKTISSNQQAAERVNNWMSRRHNHRNWLRNSEGRHRGNNTDQEQDIVTSQEAAIVNDELNYSQNQTVAERINNRISRKQNRRNWLRNGEERRGENSTEFNNGERRHPFMYNTIWREPNTFLPNNGKFGTQESHHRHHHRHHHHHHHHNRTTTTAPPLTTTTTSTTPAPSSKMDRHHHHHNRTTTTVPPTTTTSATPAPLSEMEQIAMYRHLTAN